MEEGSIITYTIVISNTGRAVGTISLKDLFRDEDLSKVTFVPKSIKINGVETSYGETFLRDMKFTLNASEARSITYQYKVNAIDESNMTYDSEMNKYKTTIKNELYWGENDEPERYPINRPISTIVVNVQK